MAAGAVSGSGSRTPGAGSRLRRVLLVGVAVLGLAGCDPGAGTGTTGTAAATSTATPAAAAGGPGAACAPTRGEAAQAQGGERPVAADAPSTARLGPGGEVERTAETVAAGRGGRRLVVSGTVYRADCRTPLAGASIEVWQTNAEGEYGPGQGTGDERCCYLAAALRTDRQGRYRFETVRPGHYKGERQPPPAHIHFEVRHPDAAGLLTELLFEDDPWLGPDPHGAVVRLTPVPGSDPPALSARFDIVLGPA
jgi:catechol 1,2-dioxygenase